MAPRSTLLAAAAAALLSSQASNAFVVPSAPSQVGSGVASRAKYGAQQPHHRTSPRVAFRSTKSALYSTSTDLPEISTMRVGELKQELESYGLSTKSYFEKSELVDALTKARAEGKTPIASTSSTSTSTDGGSRKKKKKVRSESASSEPSPPTGADREKRLAEEMEKCQSMKATELKAELQSLGVSTKSFFEKSEFVKALAEARVDGVKKTPAGGGAVNEEGYAEYKAADVEVLTDDRSGPRKKSRDGGDAGGPGAGGSPFGGGAGASPFGGGGMPGGMPGGMGGMDMGNIADMLKNMGMGGGPGGGAPQGANPFGGSGGSTPFGGANPFSGGMPGGMGGMGGMGDAFGKAQEMMKNPEVMKLMQEAQSNPRVMAAMTECMSNPAAMSKYINDPEIGGFMKKFQKYMG